MQNGTLCGQSYTKMLSAGHINIVADIKLSVWQKYIYFLFFDQVRKKAKIRIQYNQVTHWTS